MSDRMQTIEYRRLVSSVAAHLSPEEVERIAFIRLTGLESTKHDASEPMEPNASAISILATLERQGVFSARNIDGLMEIAKDVNRHDLMRKIETYKKTRSQAVKCGKSKAWKTAEKQPSKERKQLEEMYEMIVTRFAFLEQQVSLIPRLLDGEGDLRDEGTMILRSVKHVAEELATRVNEAHEQFIGHGSSSVSESRRRGSADRSMNRGRSLTTPELREGDFSQVLKQLLVRPPIASGATGQSAKEEDQDFTGDSGFGTASRYYDDHDAYCVVDLWKRPPGNPKPAPATTDCEYTSVMEASMNADSSYATLRTT